MMKKYVIVCGGGFAREVISWIRQITAGPSQGDVVGIIDYSPTCLDGFDYDVPYLGSTADYQPPADVELVLAVGNPKAKQELTSQLMARGGRFATIIHPTAVVAGSAKLGAGVMLCPLSLVSADATLSDFVTVNALSSVGHDARIGAFTTLSAHVDIMGFAQVGEGCLLGSGARVLPKVKVGAACMIGAGATAIRSVPDGMTLYAAPSKKM